MEIGFVGAGRMASAMAIGIAKRKMPGFSLLAYDPLPESISRLDRLLKLQGTDLRLCENNQDLFANSDVVVVAVKPQMIDQAMEGVAARDDRQLVVSVVAGTKMAKLVELTGSRALVRAMPNTPCLIGQGMIGYCVSDDVTDEQEEMANLIFYSVGQSIKVVESQLDAVTGLSGSGPAYVYSFIESLIEGGIAEGLSRDVARQLAIQTVFGAAQMVAETRQEPAALRDQVTSPGGTTLAGLEQLDQRSFGESVKAAVAAATRRSIELSQQ